MEPEPVADQVFGAIRDERLHILTRDDFDAAIRTRVENILQRRNPVTQQPPTAAAT